MVIRNVSPGAAAKELIRRERREAFNPTTLCHDGQRPYVVSRAKRKAVRTPRRVGKTVGEAIALLRGSLEPPWANQVYVTISLKNAKRLVWPTLKKLNREYQLGGVVNETEAFMRFPKLPNEPVIYLGGAKDKEEIEKLRGYEGGIKRAIIDETQSIRPSIMETLIDDILEPALMDYDGELDVVGTPGPVCAGYFYDIDVGEKRDAWEHFFWDIGSNTFLQQKSGKSAAELLAAVRLRHKWDELNPRYQREYLGQWVTDSDALALHYDRARNACAWQSEPLPGWTYILVFDIGFEDADAIAVLGYAPGERVLRLVREVITRKQGITELGNQLKTLHGIFHPQRVIGDLGALGKKIGAELEQRWNLPVEAADKTRKAEHVELLDDGLRTGAFLAPPDSVFAEDCAIVQWDATARAKGLLVFDSAYHSDILDAVLYGYRAGYHWAEPDPPPPPKDDLERHRAQIRAELAEVARSEAARASNDSDPQNW